MANGAQEPYQCRATQTTPRWHLLAADKNEPLAIDIEFVDWKLKANPESKFRHRLGRVALTNTRGQTIYDVYVNYPYNERVRRLLPPPVFGVLREDLMIRNGAKESKEVLKNLGNIIHGRTIVGHGMTQDLTTMDEKIWDRASTIVDTQHLYGQVKLSSLAAEFLDDGIQKTFHDPSEDASATMGLYLLKHPYQGRNGFKDAAPTVNNANGVKDSSEATNSPESKEDSVVGNSSPKGKENALQESTTSAEIETALAQLALEVGDQSGKQRKKGKKGWKPFPL
ncbi:hypothetical protein BDY17DRAFT_324375 [Neohortaea acidophila]|uniref:Exonuclease domain-containing protein n=1 Tax=Neohortaea acidophila TaxID=245834 RepID=A0A6A6PU75_9PEZI|nr:uncharacterized protein BDY17DRAFT_324375 [Neohortaea acidophila]KAF2483658.1 hypothetical protein BDY17DRAFT_324375 [Neohortaea acidophila]